MSAPTGASDPSDLVEGEVWAVDALAGGVAALGAVLGSAAESMRSLETPRWHGRAADAAERHMAEVPSALSRAEQAFAEATAALEAWARELQRAQQLAGDAIDNHAYGDRLTGTWLCTATEAEIRVRDDGPDPGRRYRIQAEEELAEAKRIIDLGASECIRRLSAAADSGYQLVPWWKTFGHHATEVLSGVGQGIQAIAEVPPALFEAGYWLLDTTPVNFDDRLDTVRRVGRRIADDPVAFVEQAIGWDTLIENPDQWIGQVAPDVVSGRTLGAAAAVYGTGVTDEVADGLRLLVGDERGAISFGVRAQRIEAIVRSFRNVHITVAGREMIITGSDLRYMLSRHHPELAITAPRVVHTFYPPGMTPKDLVDTAIEVLERNWEEVGSRPLSDWPRYRASVNGNIWEVGVRDSGHIDHVVLVQEGT